MPKVSGWNPPLKLYSIKKFARTNYWPGGKVETRERSVLVEEAGDGAGVGNDSCDVATSGEGAEHLAISILVETKVVGQSLHVDVPEAVEADLHHLGEALAPGEKVGVVLIGPHQHHPSLFVA